MAAVGDKRLLFVVTEDWYFLSHRIALARAAQADGWQVHLATRVGEHEKRLRDEGIIVHPLTWNRRSKNPFAEIRALLALVSICRKVRPAIVHYVALKMIVYGAIVQLFAPRSYAVNAVSGLGSVFSVSSLRTRLLRTLINSVLAWFLSRQTGIVIVQNPDDGDFFRERGFVPKDGITLIAGAGIDTETFRPGPEPAGDTIVASVVARMLWDKGLAETVEAARLLKARNIPVRLRLIGPPDPENPNSVNTDALRQWSDEGLVEWMGARSDIDNVWAESHIGVLASYREGLPRSLLEAAACGRPMVTTDTSGCRMLVKHDENGLVVPVADAVALADAIERLAVDPDLRARLGKRAREMVLERFSDAVIVEAFLALYRTGLEKIDAGQPDPS